MSNNFKIMGTTADETDCRCCGKRGLKKTVILGVADADGNVLDVTYYGVDCAASAMLGKKSSSNRKIIESKASAIAHGRALLAAGREAKAVAKAIWNRFGYLTEVRGGRIVVAGVGEIEF